MTKIELQLTGHEVEPDSVLLGLPRVPVVGDWLDFEDHAPEDWPQGVFVVRSVSFWLDSVGDFTPRVVVSR
jgi:hypothetical protein